jgi:hypothetical protein
MGIREIKFGYGDYGVRDIMDIWLANEFGITSGTHSLRLVRNERLDLVRRYGTDRDEKSWKDGNIEKELGLATSDYTFVWSGYHFGLKGGSPTHSTGLIIYRNPLLVCQPKFDYGTGALHTWVDKENKIESIEAIVTWDHR